MERSANKLKIFIVRNSVFETSNEDTTKSSKYKQDMKFLITN